MNDLSSFIIEAMDGIEQIEIAEIENPPAGREIADPENAVRTCLAEVEGTRPISAGETVAITVGSRGIHGLVEIVKSIVSFVRGSGAEPFVVPSMGSHGGGTAEGQAALLANLGITPRSIDAPVRSSMETTVLGETASGIPVRFDRLASKADHIIAMNRVKPHTRFSGAIQSGLCKICLVGLGNAEGAQECHRAAVRRSFDDLVAEALPVVLEKAPLTLGVALVENGMGRLGSVRAALPRRFIDADRDSLELAEKWQPWIPFDEIDILVVDRIGKDVSGTGMDTNVIGRKEGTPHPRVTRIFVRGLTKASSGNATGIGFADAITSACAAAIDRAATTLNCFTALRPEGARIPAVFESDREAIAALLPTTGRRSAADVRLVRIESTASLSRMTASAPLIDGPGAGKRFRQITGKAKLVFDAMGNLPSRGE